VIAQTAPDALALALALDDRSRAFRACRSALDGFGSQDAVTGRARVEHLRWAEQAYRYAKLDSIERIIAAGALGAAWIHQNRKLEARALKLEAVALARELGDPESLFNSALPVIVQGPPQRWDERRQLVEDSVGWSRGRVSGRTLGTVLWYCGRLLLAQGKRGRAEDRWRQAEEVAEQTHSVSVRLHVRRATSSWR
jgi:hypothetical protein